MTAEEELKYYKLALQREKLARKEAERLLENKALELYHVNKKLLAVNAGLEQNIFDRTERIKEAEEKFSRLIESASDIIFETNLKGEFIYVNPRGAQLVGKQNEYLIGENFISLIHADFQKELLDFYQVQFRDEIPSTYIEYKIAGEKDIWLGQRTELVYKDGFPVGFFSVSRDITEQVNSELQLKLSEEKYRDLFEGSFDGVMRLDTNGQFLEWNSKIIEILGYSNEELGTIRMDQIIHPEDRKKSQKYLIQLLTKGYYSNYTGRIIKKNGEIVHIEVNSTATYKDGELTGSIENVRDVTERVAFEKVLTLSEEKYRGILENLELGLLEVDLDELITKVYPSFCQLTGYTEEDLIGKNPSRFLLHPESAELMKVQNELRKEGQAAVYEVQIRRKSGDYRWVMVSGAPFYDDKGNLIGSVGVHLDITNRKKMEEDLKEANKIAQASSKAKELFLANMSHEIRTPLNAVIGLSGLIQKTKLNGQQEEYIKNINNSAENLLLLVNDILDFTKIESGKLEVNIKPFDLKKTVVSVMASTNYLAEQKALKLTLDFDERLVRKYKGDELKIVQILINLVNNAIKFTSAGSVTIYFSKIATHFNTDEIQIRIADTGKGIAPQALDTIFDDFKQEDSTIANAYGGTGLGLSICKRLVSLLGGTLKVESKLGLGTTFSFSICLEKAEDDRPENGLHAHLISSNIQWGNYSVLVVEDNLVNQFVITETLKSWSCKVELANNGQEALDYLSQTSFDLILMDMQMPVMDGLTATKIIRNELNLTVPIIAFTANALQQEREACLKAGMNDYVSKPFQEKVLKEKMAALLEKEYAEAELLEVITVSEIPKQPQNDFFNTDKLFELSRGNHDFVKKMVAIFVEDGSLSYEELSCSSDPKRIAAIAHKIKPSIDYLAPADLQELVRQIEARQFEKNPTLLKDFLTQLQSLIMEAEVFLKA